jgi:hypothetical protein
MREFKAEAFNVTNSFIRLTGMSRDESTFGKSANQYNLDRAMQYTLRLMF